MNERIIFFGSGSFIVPVIKKLLNHNLLLVVTSEREGPVTDFCKNNKIDFVSSVLSDTQTLDRIRILNPTVAILASYGAFIPEDVITIFPKGIINIHPSLLPKYKGPSPIQYAILKGETKTGVTLIKLDNHIDHGPIISQKPYNLKGNETTPELLNILFEIGAEMIEKIVSELEEGENIEEKEQDHKEESWSYRIEKRNGEIVIDNSPEREQIKRMIRAFYPWPTVWFRTYLKGQEKLIKLLPEDKIQVEGKNPMSYKDFINGYGEEGKEILKKLDLS